MSSQGTDPVEAADDERDLYGISSWERRSLLDSASVAVYRLAVRTGQILSVLLAVLIFISIGGLSVVRDPSIGVLTVLSALPALALAGYVWYSDVTANEPLSLLAATFILGVLTAGFAAVVNGLFQPVFTTLGGIGMVLFFYLIVGPVEESVKLLAVRLYACDILPRLKARASHPVLAEQVNPKDWESKVCWTVSQWLCHEAVTRTP